VLVAPADTREKSLVGGGAVRRGHVDSLLRSRAP
jgi:hypothetical protein